MDFIKLVHVDTLSCEAIFRIAPNGDYIIVSQCGDVCEPAPLNRVYLFRSTDYGKSWSAGKSVYPEDGNAVYATEVWVHEGIIDVFLTIHDGGFLHSKNVVMRSADNGNSFTQLMEFPQFEGLIFARGVIQSNGKIIIPFQRHRLSYKQMDELAKLSKNITLGDVECIENGVYSFDTFPGDYVESSQTVDIATVLEGKRIWKWSEPTVCKLSNGNLVMLLRVDGTGYLYRSISTDNGMTWSSAEKTDIPNPGNKPKLINTTDGRIVLINTFNSVCGYKGRRPISIWISNDDMRTWSYKRTSVQFDGWLSYPDGIVTEDNKQVLFAFEFNRHDVYFVRHDICE